MNSFENESQNFNSQNGKDQPNVPEQYPKAGEVLTDENENRERDPEKNDFNEENAEETKKIKELLEEEYGQIYGQHFESEEELRHFINSYPDDCYSSSDGGYYMDTIWMLRWTR